LGCLLVHLGGPVREVTVAHRDIGIDGRETLFQSWSPARAKGFVSAAGVGDRKSFLNGAEHGRRIIYLGSDGKGEDVDETLPKAKRRRAKTRSDSIAPLLKIVVTNVGY
jgi:hypothetical protein